jgi:hypothetical protein
MHLHDEPQTGHKLRGGMLLLLLIFPLLVLGQQRQTPLPEVEQILVEPEERPVRDDGKTVFSFGLVVMGLLLGMLMQGYRRLQQNKQMAQQFHQQRRQLLACIAELDDRYAQGDIQKLEYQQERLPLKQHLLEVTIRCKSES